MHTICPMLILGWLKFLANICSFYHWVKGKSWGIAKVWVAKKSLEVVIWRLNCWEKFRILRRNCCMRCISCGCSSSKVDVGKLDLQRILSWDDHVSALLRCSDDPLRSFEDWRESLLVCATWKSKRSMDAKMSCMKNMLKCWLDLYLLSSSLAATNKH